MTGVRGLKNHRNNTRLSPDNARPHPQLELLLKRRKNSSRIPAAAPDKDGTSSISCKYVVAADGAGSSVRAAIGIGLSGRRELGHLVNIHFRCRELGGLLLGEGEGRQRPGMLYFVYNEVRERESERGVGALS